MSILTFIYFVLMAAGAGIALGAMVFPKVFGRESLFAAYMLQLLSTFFILLSIKG